MRAVGRGWSITNRLEDAVKKETPPKRGKEECKEE
jgi:hypothetical protein